MSRFVEEGKVRYLSICEHSAETVCRAHAVHPLSVVPSEYSLFKRDAQYSGGLATVKALGIDFVAFQPFGRGQPSGRIRSPQDLAEGDARKNLPQFKEGNIGRNSEVVDELDHIAKGKSITVAQLALAWLMHQDVSPIPGTKRRPG